MLTSEVMQRLSTLAGTLAVRVRKHFNKRPVKAPETKELLFVFGGRANFNQGIGKDLYETNNVFREVINKCNTITESKFGRPILGNFINPESTEQVFDETDVCLILTANQIALAELWRDMHFVPDRVVGISLGEFAAAYFCGAIGLEEALTLCYSTLLISEMAERNYSTVIFLDNWENVQRKCALSPKAIIPFYSAGPKTTLGLCCQEDVSAITGFFSSQGMGARLAYPTPYWPFHTHLIDEHAFILKNAAATVEGMPLKFPYYSCSSNSEFGKNSFLPAGFWYGLIRNPVRLHEVLQLLPAQPEKVVVHLGPDFLLRSQFEQSLPGRNRVYSSFETSTDNVKSVENLKAQLVGMGLMRKKPDANILPEPDSFLQQVNTLAPEFMANPHPGFVYLRKFGPVHHLPEQKAWLVLGTTEINYALKNPQIYSSKIHQAFDMVLLGSDPPSHTTIRAALQPVFSPQGSLELEDFAWKTALMLAKDFPRSGKVDIVSDFSLPLAQKVIAHFLGLGLEEEKQIQEIIAAKGHLYSLNYLPDLTLLFRNFLLENSGCSGNAVLSAVNGLIESGQLTLEEAVSLLRMLWVAGTTTTSILISNTIHYLTEPTIRQALKQNESLIPVFIEECLRLHPPEATLKRVTTQKTILAGKPIPENALILLSLEAANRDPGLFPNPDELTLTKAGKRHLTFGGGFHYCLGVSIARAEARGSIKALLQIFSDLRLENSGAAVQYYPSDHFRGLQHLYTNPVAEV